MGALVESKPVRRMENRGGSCQPRRQAAHPGSLQAMGVNDVITGASQKPVEAEKATQIEERDVMLHDADIRDAQNVLELPVDGEHTVCQPSCFAIRANWRTTAEPPRNSESP